MTVLVSESEIRLAVRIGVPSEVLHERHKEQADGAATPPAATGSIGDHAGARQLALTSHRNLDDGKLKRPKTFEY